MVSMYLRSSFSSNKRKIRFPSGFKIFKLGALLFLVFFPRPPAVFERSSEVPFQNTAILRFEIYYSCPMLTQQPFIADDLPARELLSLKKACMVFYDASGALAWQDLEVLNPFKKPPPFSAGWSN